VSVIWRPWPGDERYRVTDRGQVRGPSYLWTGKELRPQLIGGYPTVCIGRKMIYVHIMVLETFAGPCPPGMECRHLNGVRADCRWPENLCWGTHSDNMRDRVAHGRHPNAAKEKCPSGHDYDGSNLYKIVYPDGRVSRYCRTCHRAACNRYYQRKHHMVPA
jgi:hypothetical protein